MPPVLQTGGTAANLRSGSARASLASIPLFFEANTGQTDPRVRFLARSSGYTLFVTPTESVFVGATTRNGGGPRFGVTQAESKSAPPSVVRMKLAGANPAPLLTGLDELPGKVNYLIGNDPRGWHTGVPLYSQVRSEQVYPGVDLLFHGDQRQLEYDFVVAPGADPKKIAFRVTGTKRVELDPEGNLVLHSAGSQILMHKPAIYQSVGSERHAIEGGFALKGKHEVGFQLSAYDRSQPLVIDPTISYATFLGGAGEDQGNDIVLDTSTPGAPKMYVPGSTLSILTTFPEFSTSTLLGVSGGAAYTFLAKIDPSFTGLQGAQSLDYLTFIGGSLTSLGAAGCLTLHGHLDLDKSQGVANIEPVMAGETNCRDFPVTTGSLTSGGTDNYLTRLMPNGAALDDSIFFGGNGRQAGGWVSVDGAGNAILTGGTTSTDLLTSNPLPPGTPVAYATSLNKGSAGFADCFAAKFDRLFALQYLTYWNVGAGSTANNQIGCGAIAGPSGTILGGGNTPSATAFANAPSGTGGFQTTFHGTEDTFGLALDPSKNGVNQLIYWTFIGGGASTTADYGAVPIGGGVVAIVGNTTSSLANNPPDIPVNNCYQNTNTALPTSSKGTGFLTVIDTTKTGPASLLCGTYFGGSGGDDRVQSVGFDPVGGSSSYRILLGGQTSSTDFPLMNPLQSSLVPGQNGFVSVLSVPSVPGSSSGPPFGSLLFSTYIGGGVTAHQQSETVQGVAADSNHTIYARGRTLSDNFFANTAPPTIPNGFQTRCSSCSPTHATPSDDVVVFVIKTDPTATLQTISVTPVNPTISAGQTQQFTATGTYSDGTIQDLTSTVAWSSSNTGVATISNAAGSQGLGTGAGKGTSLISATQGGITSSTTLTVTADLVSIAVAPTNASVAAGNTLQFTATGTYTDSSMQNLTNSVVWNSSVQTAATISASGLATGVAAGQSMISATSGAISSTPTTLTVVAAAPSLSLTVALNGAGFGKVTDSSSLISCPNTCTAGLPSGGMVTLTAVPEANSTFVGWGGACSGTAACIVNMTAATSVTATFTATSFPLTVMLQGSGFGSVSSSPAGISCNNILPNPNPSACAANFPAGSAVVLTASANPGSTFAGWLSGNGSCSGTGTCSETMTDAQSAIAVFNQTTIGPNIITTFAGGGPVNSSPTLADIGQPSSVVRDAAGNTYIAIASPNAGNVFKLDNQGNLTFFAGVGWAGFNGDNVPATTAALWSPSGLALDTSGNVYFAEGPFAINLVRRVDVTTGNISIVAGTCTTSACPSGSSGDGGPATQALLNSPQGVAVDSLGNVFIADTFNNVIRKVDNSPQHIITTYAGTGTQGHTGDGGPATQAQLSAPGSVAVDALGNLFISEGAGTCDVRKVDNTPQHIITTYAGTPNVCRYSGDTGPANQAQLNFVFPLNGSPGISADTSGNLFIADSGNLRIRKVDNTAQHIISTVAGNGTQGFAGDNGPAASAELNIPQSVAADSSGNLLIADTGNARVRIVDASGTITTLAGGGTGGDGGPATNATLASPGIVALDPSGNLAIQDPGTERIREVNAISKNISTIAGNGIRGSSGSGVSATSASFVLNFRQMAFDHNGNLFFLDFRVVREIAAGSTVETIFAGNGSGCRPATAACGDGGPATSASFTQPFGLAVDSLGNVYISDVFTQRIRKVDVSTSPPTISTIAGNGTTCSSPTAACGDGGPASAAILAGPFSMAFDALDNLYFADSPINVVRKIDHATNIITRVAFNGQPTFSGDGGPALSASMEGSDGVASDAAGNLFIGGGFDNVVRRVDAADGTVTTVAGNAANPLPFGFSGDGGLATAATLGNFGLAVDANKNLFIADGGNNRIRMVHLAPVATVQGTLNPFGPTTDGQVSAAQALTILNSGLDDLTISLSITPGFGAILSCTAGNSAAPAQHCTVSVTFSPVFPDSGTVPGTLTILTNDPVNPIQTFALSGTAVLPNFTLTVTESGLGSGTVASQPGLLPAINCPTTCSASYPQGTIVTLTATPAAGSLFGGWTGACSNPSGTCTVAMNQAQNVTATFNPAALISIVVTPNAATARVGHTVQFTATGTFSDGSMLPITGSVTWASADTTIATISNAVGSQGLATGVALGTSTITATLGGISGLGQLTVTLPGVASVSPPSLNFGPRFVGGPTPPQSVSLSDTGAGPLGNISITSNNLDYTVTNNTCPVPPATLAAGASPCTFDVTFAPSFQAPDSGAIVITDDAAVGTTLVPLTGTGVATVNLTPFEIFFDGQAPGTTSPAQTATFLNGSANATVTGIAPTTVGHAAGDFAVVASLIAPCGATLAPLSNCMMGITFTPSTTVPGPRTADLTIANPSTTPPTTYVSHLTGNGAIRHLPGFVTNTFPPNDDNSTARAPFGFPNPINFFGTTYSGVFINNNGNITFNAPLSTFTPFGLTSDVGTPIIAPFFADVDTRGTGSGVVTYGTDTVNGRPAFGVDYENVGYYGAKTDKLDSFQVILIDRSDVAPGDFDIEFNYDKIQWETGDASGGTNGLGGSSAVVGYSNGTGIAGTFFQLPGSAVNGAFLDVPTAPFPGLINSDLHSMTLGGYFFQVRNGAVQSADLALTMAHAPDPVAIGANETFTLTVTNNGPNDATGVVVTDTLPGNATFVSATPGQGTCIGTAPLTCNLGTLSNAASTTITIVVTTTAVGTVTNTASVSSNLPDPNPANNSVSASATVSAAPQQFTLTVGLAGTGSGTVASQPGLVPAINCPTTCSASYAQGAMVTLTAAPAAGSTFAGWNGACTNAAGTCSVTLNQGQNVTATFNIQTFPLSVMLSGNGSGTVTSAPSGINCPTACSASFASGSSVTLTATPANGSTFGGWGEACAASGTATSCSVTTNAAQSVAASFNLTSGVVSLQPTSPSATTATVTPGETAVFPLVLTSNGVTGQVSLSCSSSAPTITCEVVPSVVTLSASGTTQAAIALQTFCNWEAPGLGPSGDGPGRMFPLLCLAVLLASLLLASAGSSRKVFRAVWPALGLVILIAATQGCGSLPHGTQGRTAPGTYQLTVTAKAPSGATSSIQLTLVVQ